MATGEASGAEGRNENHTPATPIDNARLDSLVKRGTPDHPKLLKLARALKIGRAQTVGHLELLWHFCARYSPHGDVGRWTDEDLAAAAHWDPERGAEVFVEALVTEGWLDRDPTHRLLVHDWPDHADDSVKKSLKREDQRERGVRQEDSVAQFARPTGRIDSCLDVVQTTVASGPDNGGLPSPALPCPAKPSQEAANAAPSAARSRAKKAPIPGDAQQIEDLLADLVATYFDGYGRPKRRGAWAVEIAKLHDNGRGPSWAEIEAAVRFCYSGSNDVEARVEVRSGKALREKFITIQAAIKRANRGNGSLPAREPPEIIQRSERPPPKTQQELDEVAARGRLRRQKIFEPTTEQVATEIDRGKFTSTQPNTEDASGLATPGTGSERRSPGAAG